MADAYFLRCGFGKNAPEKRVEGGALFVPAWIDELEDKGHKDIRIIAPGGQEISRDELQKRCEAESNKAGDADRTERPKSAVPDVKRSGLKYAVRLSRLEGGIDHTIDSTEVEAENDTLAASYATEWAIPQLGMLDGIINLQVVKDGVGVFSKNYGEL